jgi:hypothetical protein
MLSVLLDQNFNYDLLQGLLRRIPTLDYITAFQAGVGALDDPALLRWAAERGLLLLTHDMRTMPRHIAEVIAAGDDISGVVIVPDDFPFAQAINELELIIICSSKDEWHNHYRVLPL